MSAGHRWAAAALAAACGVWAGRAPAQQPLPAELAAAAAAGDAVALPAVLDLPAAVAVALAHNPALQAVVERRSEVAAGVRQAKADAFPQFTATSGWSRSRNPAFLNSPDFEDILENFPGGDFTPSEQTLYTASVEVSQPLFTFGKIAAAIDLARLFEQATDEQISTARLDTGLAAAEAWLERMSAGEQAAAIEAQERARREALAVVEARFELGEATRLELLRARAAVAEVEPGLVEARGRMATADSRLRRELGLPPATPLPLPARADGGAGEPAALPPPPPLLPLLAQAVAHRPELADLALQQQALGRRQQVERAAGLPQLEFDGRYGRQSRLPENLDDALFDDWSVAVTMSWEFFDGNRRNAEIARLESQRRQLALTERDARNGVLVEIEQALSAYTTALARHEAALASAEAAREASRVARESYEEGVALQVDWLDAQQREIAAEIGAVDAYYGARTAAARLARAVGSLPTEPLAVPSPEASSSTGAG